MIPILILVLAMVLVLVLTPILTLCEYLRPILFGPLSAPVADARQALQPLATAAAIPASDRVDTVILTNVSRRYSRCWRISDRIRVAAGPS